MAERYVKIWVCDRCHREATVKKLRPPGWHEASGFYGNTAHACGDFECEHWLRRFCEQNGIPVPDSLRAETEAPRG